MKHNWEYKNIGDMTISINGLWTGKKPPFVQVGVIRNTNFTKDCKLDASDIFYTDVEIRAFQKRKLEKGDIIIEKSGGSEKQPVGRPILFNLDGDFSFSNFTATLRLTDSNVLPNFFHKVLYGLYIKGETRKLQSRTTGLYNLNWKEFLKLNIPVPPMEVQERIVAELDEINGMIEVKRDQLKQLDLLAQSIFYSSFGDPISNPKRWETDKIGNILTVERGGSPRPIKEYITDSPNGINWIKIGDTGSSMYITSTKEKIKPEGKTKSRYVMPGDFILSNSMSFGRPYILKIDGCIHDGWLLLRDEYKLFNKIFLYYCLNSSSIYSEFERLVRTGTVSNLNSDIVRGVKIPVPPLELQQQFAARVEAIEARKAEIEASINELQTLLNARMDFWFN